LDQVQGDAPQPLPRRKVDFPFKVDYSGSVGRKLEYSLRQVEEHLGRGEYRQAIVILEGIDSRYRLMKDWVDVLFVNLLLGDVLFYAEGKYERAAHHYAKFLQVSEQIMDDDALGKRLRELAGFIRKPTPEELARAKANLDFAEEHSPQAKRKRKVAETPPSGTSAPAPTKEEKKPKERVMTVADLERIQRGGCFIATAVYGPDAPELFILRAFRDRVLAQSQAGRAFIRLYYLLSPPIAGWLAVNSTLRNFIKTILLDPVICFLTSKKDKV